MLPSSHGGVATSRLCGANDLLGASTRLAEIGDSITRSEQLDPEKPNFSRPMRSGRIARVQAPGNSTQLECDR